MRREKKTCPKIQKWEIFGSNLSQKYFKEELSNAARCADAEDHMFRISVYLHIYLSIYMSGSGGDDGYTAALLDSEYLSIFLSIYMSGAGGDDGYTAALLDSEYLSIYLSNYLSIYLSVYLSGAGGDDGNAAALLDPLPHHHVQRAHAVQGYHLPIII